MISAEETANFEVFRDCLSTSLIQKFATEPRSSKTRRKGGRHGRKKSQALTPETGVENDSNGKDAEELSEFIDPNNQYVATEVFTSLPAELRTLTYTTYTNAPTLKEQYAPPLSPTSAAALLQNLDPSITETLTTYALLPPAAAAAAAAASTPTDFLAPILSSYLSHLTTAPLPPSQTRDLAEGCEICGRAHVPLTYHHLIPRAVHEKAVRRGWHAREQLGTVAWLCRACHSFVHGLAGHEELARELYTVERLLGREEVRGFAAWVGRVRWRKR